MAQPNIVFILIDDMGWKDLSCYGSSFYETPNIDRIASAGALFTNAYAACPVCSPTRASIMSGKYPATVGLTDWIGSHARGRLIDAPYVDHLPLEECSLASALQQGGYTTWHVGKWHLGGRPYYPENHGFMKNIGGCDWGHPRKGHFSPYHIETLPDGPDGEYLTDRLTDEAISLIRAHKTGPFFLNLWHYAVHTPVQAKEHDIAKYAAKAHELGLDKNQTFAIGDYFPCEHKKHQRIKRRLLQSDPGYAAMIANLDWNVGRLLDALSETGHASDTIVVFTSDNGGLATAEGSPTCNAPLSEGKGWLNEGGIRVPLIVQWPGVTVPGSVCHEPVTSPDFYPTFLEMARLPLRPAQHVDGVSLVQLLAGEQRLEREAIYWHYPHYGNQGGTPCAAVRAQNYKLIKFFEDQRIELYDLANDPGEQHNLAHLLPGIADKLHKALTTWQQQVDAKMPEVNPDYRE